MKLTQRWQKTTIANKMMVWTSLIVALGTLFYAGAAIFQLHLMNESARQASEQTDRLIAASERLANATHDAVNVITDENTKSAARAEKAIQTSRDFADSAKRQAGAMQQQANTSAKQLEITDRPWVGIAGVEQGNLTFNENGLRIPIKIVARNLGRSTAIQTTLNYALFVPKAGGVFTEPLERQRTVCQKVNSRIMAYSLFPGNTSSEEITFNLGNNEIDAGLQAGFFSLFLVGCLDYLSTGHSAHHQTGFIYQILRIDPEHPGARLTIKNGLGVPSNLLVLDRVIFGGDFAN